jgi:hypothetical protein
VKSPDLEMEDAHAQAGALMTLLLRAEIEPEEKHGANGLGLQELVRVTCERLANARAALRNQGDAK